MEYSRILPVPEGRSTFSKGVGYRCPFRGDNLCTTQCALWVEIDGQPLQDDDDSVISFGFCGMTHPGWMDKLGIK